MSVNEELEILADDKRVKQLLVDQIERTHGPVLPWIVNRVLEHRGTTRLRRCGQRGDVDVKLGRLRNASEQRHAATTAFTGAVRADVRIHRADVDSPLRWIDGDLGCSGIGGRCWSDRLDDNRRI